ncbi:RHS repeat domain-containing protein [Flavobacterium soyae]|uniref:RHS repeat domain-containing protein n=1 Tax=Flavobacterium soyae TaxID=2903098 RepID=A0ABZ2UKE8_9FLAO
MKNIKTKQILFFTLLFLISLKGFTQVTSTYIPKLNIPSSPETSKFNQFIDTPVGYNTGIPNIDINLGEINIDGVSVPISLSYHSDGIKVDEKATWVGLGWSLNAGYKVSRKENGIPDESRLFFQLDSNSLNSIQGIKNFSDNNPQTIPNAMTLSTALKKENTNSDYRPDEFNYSTSNSSAKFLFSQLKQKFVAFPSNMDKIEVDYQLSKINTIKITDDSGIKYFYGIDANAKERTNPLTHNFYNSWNISKIENIKNQVISFSYNLYNLQNYERPVVLMDNLSTSISNDQLINLESSYVSEINYPEGKIEFIAETNRQDLKQFPKLNSIIFRNKANQVIKTIIFNYSYFTNTLANIASDNFTENSGKRLKLDGIDVFNNINTEKQSYSFTYYDANIPDRLKGGSDYWGYYNGTLQNGVPSRVKYSINSTTGQENPDVMGGYYSGADKNINTQTFNTFLLKSITYPTGGKQEYVYENNFGKLSSNTDQTFFCLANKYLPVNQKLLNYNINVFGLFSQTYADGIYFGSPQPSEIVTLNQYEKKYIFRTSIPINDSNVKSIGKLYTNNLSHNFDKTVLGVTNASQLNMGIEEKRYLIKNGVKTLISGPGSLNTSLPNNNEKYISYYAAGFSIDNYDTFEIEISFIYNKLLTPQLNNKPFNFNYNLDDVKKDFNQIYNDNIYLIGGARIKEINVIDKNSIIKKRGYKYSDDFSESGLAYYVPSFSQRRVKFNRYVDDQCGLPCGYIADRYWSYSSDGIFNTSNGSNVAYQYIEEQIYGIGNSYLGKTVYEYYLSTLSSDSNYTSFNANPYSFINTFDWVNKSLRSKKIYNSTDAINPLVKEEYEYFFNKPNITESVDEIRNDLAMNDMIIGQGDDCLDSMFYTYEAAAVSKKLPYFKHFLGFSLPKTKTTTEYFNGAALINTTSYNYNFNGDLLLLKNELTTNSKNENLEKKYYYPVDSADPVNSNLVAANRISKPIDTETYRNGSKLSENKTIYVNDASTAGLLLPKYEYAAKFPNNFPNIPNVGTLENKITYNQYDSNGNIQQYTVENGVSVTIIWGYDKTRPIAKIENATYADVASQVANLQSLSDTGTEDNLILSLNDLRTSLPLAMVTTYTYIPLIGVSTITDPKGEKTTYTYDSFGRLEFVKDSKGNILSENEYHYKQ